MRRLALAALSLAFLSACQPATTELTEEQKADNAAEVNALRADFWHAWREWDVDRGMSYYRNSPDFIVANDGELIKGWNTFDEAIQSWNVESQTIAFNESRTTVLAPDAVHLVEQGTYSVTDTTGVTRPEVTFAASTLWVLRDGEWKVDFAHISRLRSEAP
jgi:hypothetical protein